MGYRADISPSKKEGKKWKVVVFLNNKKIKTLHIGEKGANDFTKTGDVRAKAKYLKRHRPNQRWDKNGITTSGFWSRWLTWNKRTLQSSARDIKKRFGVRVNLPGSKAIAPPEAEPAPQEEAQEEAQEEKEEATKTTTRGTPAIPPEFGGESVASRNNRTVSTIRSILSSEDPPETQSVKLTELRNSLVREKPPQVDNPPTDMTDADRREIEEYKDTIKVLNGLIGDRSVSGTRKDYRKRLLKYLQQKTGETTLDQKKRLRERIATLSNTLKRVQRQREAEAEPTTVEEDIDVLRTGKPSPTLAQIEEEKKPVEATRLQSQQSETDETEFLDIKQEGKLTRFRGDRRDTSVSTSIEALSGAAPLPEERERVEEEMEIVRELEEGGELSANDKFQSIQQELGKASAKSDMVKKIMKYMSSDAEKISRGNADDEEISYFNDNYKSVKKAIKNTETYKREINRVIKDALSNELTKLDKIADKIRKHEIEITTSGVRLDRATNQGAKNTIQRQIQNSTTKLRLAKGQFEDIIRDIERRRSSYRQ